MSATQSWFGRKVVRISRAMRLRPCFRIPEMLHQATSYEGVCKASLDHY
jgi:hypothetical protein